MSEEENKPTEQEIADEFFEMRFIKGIPISRAILQQGIEIPLGGVETSMYRAKGVIMRHVPGDGLYCKYKERRFFVAAANYAGWWL